MITRYTASIDNTITNAFDSSLIRRGTKGNMGASDSLEVFYIANQAYMSSSEKSRVLIKFETDKLTSDRTLGVVPPPGEVDFYLNLFNIQHASTLPRNCTLSIMPISSSWDEGGGLDMEEYRDLYASNWFSASSTVPWINEGGDFLDSLVYSANLFIGDEDVSVKVTDLVESWLSETIENHGVCIKLSGSYETGSDSYYTKKFSARGTEYFFNRPILEARWNSSITDDRGNFFISSSLADANSNTNNIYLTNKIRGSFRDIPVFVGKTLTVQIHADSIGTESLGTFPASKLSEGIYSSSVILYNSGSVVYDKWFANADCYYTGTIEFRAESNIDQYYSQITNLKSDYSNNEKVRLNVFTRGKNWHPTVYTKASIQIVPDIIENLHYKVVRPADNLIVIDYDKSENSTKLSYDISGSYFTLDTSLLEEDYQYEIRFKCFYDDNFVELPDKFRFRIRKETE